METKKLIIFDYDDTLIKRDLRTAFEGLNPLDKIVFFVQEEIGKVKDIRKALQKASLLFNLSLNDEKLNYYSSRYIDCYLNGKIEPKVAFLLEKLSKNYSLVILTNGNKNYKIAELKKNNVLHFFRDIITPEESKFEKPAKEAFLFVLQKYGFRPEEAISIGNSYTFDIKPAKEIGMKTVWVTKNVADLLIPDLSELRDDYLSKL